MSEVTSNEGTNCAGYTKGWTVVRNPKNRLSRTIPHYGFDNPNSPFLLFLLDVHVSLCHAYACCHSDISFIPFTRLRVLAREDVSRQIVRRMSKEVVDAVQSLLYG